MTEIAAARLFSFSAPGANCRKSPAKILAVCWAAGKSPVKTAKNPAAFLAGMEKLRAFMGFRQEKGAKKGKTDKFFRLCPPLRNGNLDDPTKMWKDVERFDGETRKMLVDSYELPSRRLWTLQENSSYSPNLIVNFR
ncbi:hypothetical protein [Anaerotruncus massiliensis (ex Togo et al. 2019)]|nr:hypothetical protein [Anaerotruncus massiliensis (ex Togo et al. 2019)]